MKGLHLHRVLFAVVVFAVSSIAITTTRADDYPNRRIRFIVPHPAGAQVDVIARLIGQRMSEMWGQPVTVENRLGANGNIGAQSVARSEPDGYTLMFSTNGPLAINIGLFRSMGFDPRKDLEPVALICTSSTLISSSLSLPVKTIADVIALAKKEPGKLAMGTGGAGTGGHFTLAELNKMAGIDILHVPYRGSTQANMDLAGGTIPLVSSDATAMIPLIQAGKIRPLATAGAKRLGRLPDVPTVAETAIPGFNVSLWIAVSAPAGTPPQIVSKLNTTINSIVALPKYTQRVIDQGCNPEAPRSPQQVHAFIQKEIPIWLQRVRDAKLKVQ